MAALAEAVRTQPRKRLAGLKEPVKLIVFTQDLECQFRKSARELAEKLSTVSEKLSCTVYGFANDREKAKQSDVPELSAAGSQSSVLRGVKNQQFD